MSQYGFTTIDPAATSGTALAELITKTKEAAYSNHMGAARPTYAVAGMIWINNSASPWKVNFWDGSDDLLIAYVDPTTNKWTPVGVTDRYQEETIGASAKDTFTISGGYRVGTMKVYRNGARLSRSDYTATNGTTVVINPAAQPGDDMIFEWFD